MKDIHFLKPIVLKKSLEDMQGKQKEQAFRLLYNKEVMVFDCNGISFVPNTEANINRFCFYGSEAVCVYREMLGLPDVGIRRIEVNKIIQSVDDYECLSDITDFMFKVNASNERFTFFSTLYFPTLVLIHEYSLLRNRVEHLQNNSQCRHPGAHVYDIDEGEGIISHHEDIKHSLIDIGYDLITGTCKSDKKE